MWIPREIEGRLGLAATRRPAIVLTGARQVGKSSVLARLFPDHHYVSLDLPSEAESAEHEPAAFLERNPLPLIVDEVQYAPALFRHLKVVLDAKRADYGRAILTGSQRFALMQHVTESLAGRIEVLELEPLSFSELAGVRGDSTALDAIVRGGYPELWSEYELSLRPFFSSYVATYLERDLRSMLRVGSLRDFERFLRTCALRSATMLNKADLARDLGVSGHTVNEWLSVLEASGIVGLLEPWFTNGHKRLSKTPKLYFRDTGLLCFLLNIRSADELASSPLRGSVFETAVYVELRKRLLRTDEVGSLYYYRDRSIEVDFVVHRGGRFVLFESKWSEVPTTSDIATLGALARDLGSARIESRWLVCRTANRSRLEDTQVVGLEDAWD